MLPTVTFALPDGEEVEVGPGSFVGRLVHAAVCIDHPRISEAHALVSLRGPYLYLIALRGALSVDGQRVPHVRLAHGQRIGLVDELALEVRALTLPTEVLALEGLAAQPIPLLRPAYTLRADPARVQPGYDPAGQGWIWSADGHRLQLGEAVPSALVDGQSFALGSATLTARRVPLRAAGLPPTLHMSGRDPGLRVVSRHETLHLHREDGAVFTIGGIPARIVSELVEYGVPVPWELVARAIWPEQTDVYALRQNWDRHLKRLRRKLAEAGFRTNLVRADGRGNAELLLMPQDAVVDEG